MSPPPYLPGGGASILRAEYDWTVLMYHCGREFAMLLIRQEAGTCQRPQESYHGDIGIRFAQVCPQAERGGRSGAPVPESQADAQAELMAEACGFYADNILTKDHFEAVLDAKLDARFAQQDAKFEKHFAEIDRHFPRAGCQVRGAFQQAGSNAGSPHLDARRSRAWRLCATVAGFAGLKWWLISKCLCARRWL